VDVPSTAQRAGRATPKRAGRAPQPGSRFLSDAFADNVHAYRSLQRLSQEDLARKMVDHGHPSWSRATVSEVERGRRTVTIDELLALALVFNAPIGRLLDPAGLDGRGTVPLDVGGWRPMPAAVASPWVRGRISVTRRPDGFLFSPVEEFDPASELTAAQDALSKALGRPSTELEGVEQ
jgi:transcriptional regulator with XRE-family HTH domain